MTSPPDISDYTLRTIHLDDPHLISKFNLTERVLVPIKLERTVSLLSVFEPNPDRVDGRNEGSEDSTAIVTSSLTDQISESFEAEEFVANKSDEMNSFESYETKPSELLRLSKDVFSQDKLELKTCETEYVYNPKEESCKWPPISEFHPEAVPTLVKKYIECWKLDPVFKFHLAPLGTKKSKYSTVYGAEVIFSAPTPSCPNPQFNVSVYFKFEVSRLTPKTLPVHVSYNFEGQRQVHIADNRFTFQEGVLILLMKCKMKIFSELRF